jgi:UDP-N-acetylmuramoylalanine--D-glutamate ligase
VSTAAARLAAVLDRLRGRRIHVLGPSGTEGSAVIDFLLAHGIATITAHDLEPEDRFATTVARTHRWLDDAGREALIRRLRSAPIQWRQGPDYLDGIDGADVIVVTQAWFRHDRNAPVRAAADHGVTLSSMTQMFFDLWPGPTLGVSGTNGKFTVLSLVSDMLRASGIPHVVTGNDRTHVPAFYALDRATDETWLAIEISNRQLVGLRRSPRVAVVTNIAAHHLDDHGTFEAYLAAKRGLVEFQRAGDVAVLNADDARVAAFASHTPARVHWFSRRRPVEVGAFIDDARITLADSALADSAQRPLLPVGELAVPGDHMIENALAAAAAARAAGASPPAIAGALRAFRGLPYRFRLVEERAGVAFYEDSLGTNPASAAAAIRSMTRPLHLIAGGFRRRATPDDFTPMIDALAPITVRAVYLIGATAPMLGEALSRVSPAPTIVHAKTLERAVAGAWDAAAPGDAILLSPGCESFDQFADYRERGDRFVQLIATLPARAGQGAPR